MAEETKVTTEESIEETSAELPVQPEETKPLAPGVKPANIVDELRSSYINYAMSVIVARALPDARDGLKPVQRRILWGMHQMGIKPGSAFKKVARISGDVMGKYHPHGSAAIEDALVRMAQDWNMRYPLIEGQGNFGSIDGDVHAAARYIEARLDKHSEDMLGNIDKRTVDLNPNYDGLEIEPEVLPALLPNLILNGSEGIAVGMATKIPPHNLGEIVDALQTTITAGTSEYNPEKSTKPDYTTIKTVADLDALPAKRFPEFVSEVQISDLLKHIKGPDFPTGGEIFDAKEVAQVYETGRGRILQRGISTIEELKGGKFQIVITEIPYQVNKQRLVAKIAELVKDGKVTGISDIKDLSNRQGIRLVIELKRDAKPKAVENNLFKFTELQKAFNANILALVEGEPQLLNIKQILTIFLNHRQQVLIRSFEFELAKLKEREHILEGLMIALDHLDEIIAIIRKSKDSDVAKVTLMEKFKLSDIQATAILNMQLRRLSALERQKIEDEYNQVLKDIKSTLVILGNPKEVLSIISTELTQLKEKFGDKRRTKVHKGKAGEISEEDLVAEEQVFVTISEQGYIKRIKNDSYQTQGRGGVGKKAMTTKEDDSVRHVFSCSTHDEVLFFTNHGRVFALRVFEIPEYNTRTAKGVPVINLININQGELITSVLTRSPEGKILDEDVTQEGEQATENEGRAYKFLFMATRRGTVKKTEITEYANIRNSGLISIKLEEGDELVWVKPTTGNDTLMLVTREAKSIHFHEEDVRETGRATMGVRGISLRKEDEVISMDVIRKTEDFLLCISEFGFGKVTKLEQFPIQKRGGSGVFAARLNDKTGNLVAARVLDHPDRELLIMSEHGQAVRVPTQELPERNRQTSGVTMMKVKDGDRVAAITVI
ncbi:MAG: DNA gyrase subunit A [Candidatus Doudnabacteria bacterium]|nr:DNA gyrase subunit A [Candidatus Doudnabacteria bacterium]